MTNYIGLHEQYALVPPQTFVDRFTLRWTEDFGMPASEPLRKLWRTMANTYQQSIIDTAQDKPSRWRVLQPPTGSGKTMGAVVLRTRRIVHSLSCGQLPERIGSQDSGCSLAYAYSREDIVPFRLCRAGAWQGRQELPREARAAIKQTAGTRVSTRTLVPGLFC